MNAPSPGRGNAFVSRREGTHRSVRKIINYQRDHRYTTRGIDPGARNGSRNKWPRRGRKLQPDLEFAKRIAHTEAPDDLD